MNAVARATDPSTSHEAAASVNATRLESIILDKLKRYPSPGATTHELAQALGLELVSISPRMKPLKDKGLVCDTGFRVRGISGRRQIIWRAI